MDYAVYEHHTQVVYNEHQLPNAYIYIWLRLVSQSSLAANLEGNQGLSGDYSL